MSFSNCWWHCVLSGTQKDTGICAWATKEASQRHTLAFCSPLPSLHAFFFPHPLPLLKDFLFSSSTWQTFLPTPNSQTPFSGLQMHEEHQQCFQTFQHLKIRTVSLQISVLFAVTLSIVSSQSLMLPLPLLVCHKTLIFLIKKRSLGLAFQLTYDFYYRKNSHLSKSDSFIISSIPTQSWTVSLEYHYLQDFK